MNGDVAGTFAEETEIEVVVGAGPPLPPPPPLPTGPDVLPPPQPRATSMIEANAIPLAIRRRLNAVRHAITAATHIRMIQMTGGNSLNGSTRLLVTSRALVVLDGPTIEIVRADDPETLFESPTDMGERVQVVPTKAGKAQLKFTVLVIFVWGASVRVELLDCPAVIVRELGFGVMEKSGRITLTTLLVC